jgi:hypothetical protein
VPTESVDFDLGGLGSGVVESSNYVPPCDAGATADPELGGQQIITEVQASPISSLAEPTTSSAVPESSTVIPEKAMPNFQAETRIESTGDDLD